MTVEAKRIAPIHQRKFAIGRRTGVGRLPEIVVMAGSAISMPRCSASAWLERLLRRQIQLSRVNQRHSPLTQTQMRATRKRKLSSERRSIRSTPLEFVRTLSVPAETPGSTALGADDTFRPPKLSS